MRGGFGLGRFCTWEGLVGEVMGEDEFSLRIR